MTTGTMKVLDRKLGDRQISWDKGKPKEIEDARSSFDFLVKQQKYFAYEVDPMNNKKGKQVREFDPSLESLILTPPLVGG